MPTTDSISLAESTVSMVLSNHIYELQKGVRNLVLFTTRKEFCAKTVERLKRLGIDYVVHEAGTSNVNIFFGRPQCIKAVRGFVNRPLNHLSPEEDFILGAMLGYDICLECERYCERKELLN